MIKDLLRAIGVGCILAGGILYFTGDDQTVTDEDLVQLKAEINQLQTELATTKEALAVAQTVTSASTSANKQDVVKKEDSSQEEKTSQVVKAVLSIEQGSNSTTVSATLERLGIVENAKAFNDYLASNQLEGKIQIGEYEVDSSMDFKTLAQRITKGK